MRWFSGLVLVLIGQVGVAQTPTDRLVSPKTSYEDRRLVWEAILDRMVREHGYGLEGKQAVKHIPQPVPGIAREFYWAERGDPPTPTGEPDASFFRYRDGRLVRWGNTFRGGKTKGYTLAGLIDAFFGLKGRMVEGSPTLLEKDLPGDWVILDSALELPGDAPAQLKAILLKDFQLDVDLEFRKVDRPVIAVRGTYRYSPTRLDADAEKTDPEGRDVLRVFEDGAGLDMRPMASGDSDFGVFLTWLGESVDAIVLDERELQTEGQTIAWRRHPTAQDRPARDRSKADAAAILKNLESQTNLTFTKEFRPVNVMFVVPAKTAQLK